uniref:FLYWCH-type domain-containing protein n=1 Tax=Panagrolaimus sp. PS1159 TaxID=55785 RepID=A0AC35F036_9BILA
MLLALFFTLFYNFALFALRVFEDGGGGAQNQPPPVDLLATIFLSTRAGSKKNNSKNINFEGATFYSDGTQQVKDGSTNYYWTCSRHREDGCKRRITTKAISETSHRVVKLSGEHSHEFIAAVSEAKKVRAELTNLARTTRDRVIDLVEDARGSVSAPVLEFLGNRETILRSARYIKQRTALTNLHPNNPNSLSELEIPVEYTVMQMRNAHGDGTHESDFLVYDSGIEDGEDRFLCFSCDMLFELLKNS